jgi:hypothetical protein
MLRQYFDASNDLKYRGDGCVGIIAADISFDRFQILASGACPL